MRRLIILSTTLSLGSLLGAASTATIMEDFEGSTAGSGTPPAGWSLVTVAGAPTYATSGSGLGSNGAGGTAGLAGQVSSTAFVPTKTDLPGAYLVNNTALSSIGADIIATDTWYRASFTWTPTSGTTDDFSMTINDFSADTGTFSVPGFAFDSATTQFGFGSVNDTLRFDNVDITQIPEPSVFALGLLGVFSLALRRQR